MIDTLTREPTERELWELAIESEHAVEFPSSGRVPVPEARMVQRISIQGRAFIFREEGVVPYAYNDPAGHATFGVGHLIHFGPVTAADRKKYGTKTHPAPMSLVISVFNQDIRKYESAVTLAVGNRKMYQWRFDACVSLAFNIGTGGFAHSSVAREVRGHRGGFVRRAANDFLLWDNPSILRPRRERERRLFLYRRYKR